MMLEQQHGAICLMSSLAGVKGVAYDAAYTSAKHALVGLAKSLALEYGKKGIVAVPICPGFVAGEMTDRTIRGIMRRQGVSEVEATKKVADASPQKRIMPAEEVAEAVALVCSGTIPALSGQPMILGGGRRPGDRRMDPRLESIIGWIQDVIGPERKAVVPVSGGSDSALGFWLCERALPGRAVAVYIGEDLPHRAWFEAIGTVHLLPVNAGRGEPDALRWAATISHAHGLRARLIGSRNRTEDVLGTYSLPSRVVSYLPLAGLWKSDVMELCQSIGVPDVILASSRKADPDCGRPVEMAEIPFAIVDRFLQVRIGERPDSDLSVLNEGQLAYLDGIYRRNRYKAKLPLRGPLL